MCNYLLEPRRFLKKKTVPEVVVSANTIITRTMSSFTAALKTSKSKWQSASA